jgi:hypothetical protein
MLLNGLFHHFAGIVWFSNVSLDKRETGQIFYDKLGFTYIELAKFVKGEDELETPLEEWLYALKHLSRLE